MKKYIIPVVLLLWIGCAKKEAPAPSALTPSETVLKIGDALARHDSAGYINLVTSSRRNTYAMNPQLLSRTLTFWAMRKPKLEIISETKYDTTATVRYRLKIAGNPPVNVTDSTQLLLENGAWKFSR